MVRARSSARGRGPRGHELLESTTRVGSPDVRTIPLDHIVHALSIFPPGAASGAAMTRVSRQARAMPASPGEAVLDYVHPRPGRSTVRFAAPDSLASSRTGNPISRICVDYAPADTVSNPRASLSSAPSAPLRLPRRRHGWHRGPRLVEEMRPHWLRIGGYWYPRGGMPIDVFWQSGEPPTGLWLPDQGVAPYRGRG